MTGSYQAASTDLQKQIPDLIKSTEINWNGLFLFRLENIHLEDSEMVNTVWLFVVLKVLWFKLTLLIWSVCFSLVRMLMSSFSVFVTLNLSRKSNSSGQFWFTVCGWRSNGEVTSLLRRWRLWWRRETGLSPRWVCLPVCLTCCLFTCQSVSLSACLSVYLSVCLPVCVDWLKWTAHMNQRWISSTANLQLTQLKMIQINLEWKKVEEM